MLIVTRPPTANDMNVEVKSRNAYLIKPKLHQKTPVTLSLRLVIGHVERTNGTMELLTRKPVLRKQ
jgi:hypothetical protein